MLELLISGALTDVIPAETIPGAGDCGYLASVVLMRTLGATFAGGQPPGTVTL